MRNAPSVIGASSHRLASHDGGPLQIAVAGHLLRRFPAAVDVVGRCTTLPGAPTGGTTSKRTRLIRQQHHISDSSGLIVTKPSLMRPPLRRGRFRKSRGYWLSHQRCGPFGCRALSRVCATCCARPDVGMPLIGEDFQRVRWRLFTLPHHPAPVNPLRSSRLNTYTPSVDPLPAMFSS